MTKLFLCEKVLIILIFADLFQGELAGS